MYAKWKAQVEKDREQMNQTLQVSVVDKVSLDQNASAGRMHPQIQFDISIANVSQNDIQTFKGRFIVSDASGNELFRADYLDTMPVMAGVTRTDTIYTDINDTNEKRSQSLRFSSQRPQGHLGTDGDEVHGRHAHRRR